LLSFFIALIGFPARSRTLFLYLYGSDSHLNNFLNTN